MAKSSPPLRNGGPHGAPVGDCLLTLREVEQVRQLIAKTGENGAMAALGLSRGTLPRVVARLPARRATVEMVRGRLRDLREFRTREV